MATPNPSDGTKSAEEIGFKKIEFLEGELGHGAFGSVHKVRCDSLLCAAKKIHKALILPPGNTPSRGVHRIPIRRFEAEFSFLQELRHPNIIQYLGMFWDEKSEMHVLLMELMDQSLGNYIEESTKDIPYHFQVNISCDVARALSHLHVNDIIHRDLSSNNILLCGETRKAKVSDFGMAKCLNSKISSMQSQTANPGTPVFMPPESNPDGPYSQEEFQPSGDIFSLGVNIVSILCRKFPEPGSRIKPLDKVNGKKRMEEVLEVERRQNHISLINKDHPLLAIAIECLDNEAENRPTAAELCVRFESIFDTDSYQTSKKGDFQETGTSTLDLISTEDKMVGSSEPMLPEVLSSTQTGPEENYMMIDIDTHSSEKIAQLEETVAARDFRIEGLVSQLAVKENVAGRLLTDNTTLETTIKELQLKAESDQISHQSTYDNLRAENEKLLQAEKDLKANMEKLSTIRSEEVEALNTQLLKEQNLVTELRASLLQVNSELQEKKSKLTSKDSEIEGLKSQLSAKNKKKKSSSKASPPTASKTLETFEENSELVECDPNYKKIVGTMVNPISKDRFLKDENVVSENLQGKGASNKKLPIEPTQNQLNSKEKQPAKSEPGAGPTSTPGRSRGLFNGLFSSNRNSPPQKPKEAKPTSKPALSTSKSPAQTKQANSTPTATLSQTQVVEDTSQDSINRIAGSTNRSLALVKDTERIGTETLVNLKTQEETLTRVEKRLDEEHHRLGKKSSASKSTISTTPLGEVATVSSDPKALASKQPTATPKTSKSPEPVRNPVTPEPKKKRTKSDSSSSPGFFSGLFSSKKPKDNDPPKQPNTSQFPVSRFQTQAELDRRQDALQREKESTRRSLALLRDTERIGTGIAVNLAGQHEQVDRVEGRLDEQLAHLGDRPSEKYKPKSSTKSSTKSSRSSDHHSSGAGKQSAYPSHGCTETDENMEEMSRVLDRLKIMGGDIGEALDDSNLQLDRVQYKMDRRDAAVKELNKDISRQLHK